MNGELKKMRKYFTILMCFVMLFLAGCTSVEQQAEIEEVVSITDDLGRVVEVENPKRVACLIGSFAEMWQLAGGEVCATADDAWDDMDLELAEDTVNLGSTHHISVEKLLASNPDFIVASATSKNNVEMKDTLEASEIPTAYFEVSGFDDYLRVLKIFTEITGREDLYEINGVEVQKQINAVIEKSEERLQGEEGPTVLVMRVSATTLYAKNSKDTVLGEMLATLGCVNIADSDESLLENVSLEHILQMDPDYIFTVQMGSDTDGTEKYLESLLAEDSAWSKLTAVKENRWYHMDKHLYNLKPNARWGEAYEGLEEILAEE